MQAETQPDPTMSTIGDDAEAFGAWYQGHWPRVSQLAHHLLGDRLEAEDLASDVLIRVWSRWQVAGEPDNPQAYLRRAVGNEVATRIRRRTAERRAMARVSATARDDSAPDESIADRAHVDWLLAHLGVPERQTVISFYLEDRSCVDIASATGLAVSSVRSRLHRGRRHLAEAVSP